MGAKERSIRLEHELFTDVRSRIAAEFGTGSETAKAVARLDVLTSLPFVARQRTIAAPKFPDDGKIEIKEGRHPVVETVIKTPFVSNDTHFDMGKNRCAVITGPNMAGKSTYIGGRWPLLQ